MCSAVALNETTSAQEERRQVLTVDVARSVTVSPHHGKEKELIRSYPR
jgi:hypothetical protein